MPNAIAYKTASAKFDPCAIFPARVKDHKLTATEADKGTGVAGATDLLNNKVAIPTANNAYARTVRLHEALHAIYTEPSTNPEDYKILGQALEDARLHLNCAATEGIVRRDELCTALTDLRKGGGTNRSLNALLALRSAAILQSKPFAEETEGKVWRKGAKLLKKLCDQVDASFADALPNALQAISENKLTEAKDILTPYFDASESETQYCRAIGLFPNGKPEKESDEPSMPVQDVNFDKLEGKLTSEAADMLRESTIKELAGKECPKLNIQHLFATANIPTYFGEDHKHTLSGSKIDAKKLACVVGPTVPRMFLKTIRRNGGTVIIDSSGSMSIGINTLLELCTFAPLATVGFYNAPNDEVLVGNLWLFAYKGKRALNLKAINHHPTINFDKRTRKYTCKTGHEFYYGSGNVVDMQVIQWALTQPAPRYILTDGSFTGPTAHEGRELLLTAIARKKITQVGSIEELKSLLSKGQK
jgi:hypothetical protein